MREFGHAGLASRLVAVFLSMLLLGIGAAWATSARDLSPAVLRATRGASDKAGKHQESCDVFNNNFDDCATQKSVDDRADCEYCTKGGEMRDNVGNPSPTNKNFMLSSTLYQSDCGVIELGNCTALFTCTGGNPTLMECNRPRKVVQQGQDGDP